GDGPLLRERTRLPVEAAHHSVRAGHHHRGRAGRGLRGGRHGVRDVRDLRAGEGLVRRRVVATDDRGETLIELLVAMLIMGTATVAVVGGLGTAILMSDVHRKQATIAVYMDTYAAKINGAVALANGYKDCAGTTS